MHVAASRLVDCLVWALLLHVCKLLMSFCRANVVSAYLCHRRVVCRRLSWWYHLVNAYCMSSLLHHSISRPHLTTLRRGWSTLAHDECFFVGTWILRRVYTTSYSWRWLNAIRILALSSHIKWVFTSTVFKTWVCLIFEVLTSHHKVGILLLNGSLLVAYIIWWCICCTSTRRALLNFFSTINNIWDVQTSWPNSLIDDQISTCWVWITKIQRAFQNVLTWLLLLRRILIISSLKNRLVTLLSIYSTCAMRVSALDVGQETIVSMVIDISISLTIEIHVKVIRFVVVTVLVNYLVNPSLWSTLLCASSWVIHTWLYSRSNNIIVQLVSSLHQWLLM